MALPLALDKKAPSLPYTCGRCGATPESPGREYMLDLGIHIDYYGVIYICNLCVDEIATFCPRIYTEQDMCSVTKDIINLSDKCLNLQAKIDWYDSRLAEIGIELKEPTLERVDTGIVNSEPDRAEPEINGTESTADRDGGSLESSLLTIFNL